MRKNNSILPLYLFFLLISTCAMGALNPAVAEQSGSASFFSNGRSVYDQNDQAKSRQQAVEDFLVQGLTQAIGSYLSPVQMGTQFAEIRKKILDKPEKYVSSYQVFSEEQTGGLYSVVGQVSVSMGPLKEDLAKAEILVAREVAGAPSVPHAQVNAPAEETGVEQRQDEGVRPPEEPEESEGSASQPEAAPTQQVDEREPVVPSRGIVATKREILWAVAEKWEQEWVIPTDSSDIRTLFARSLAREMDDFDYTILLTQPGSVRMDLAGNIPPSQVISLGEGLGVQDVVVGKVTYSEERNTEQAWLGADLRVIRIGQGKSEFELRRNQSMEELSNQEGAVELAKRIAPELIAMLGGPQAGLKISTPERGTSLPRTENTGSTSIYFPSTQYSYWMEMETVLREQFKNIQVTGLEMGTAQSVVKLDGVNTGVILKMSGTQLPSGAKVLIDSYSTEARTMKVSFTPPGKVQAETR